MHNTRFTPPPRGTDCLTCQHHQFDIVDKGINCLHPERPVDRRRVVRWLAGCPQHTPIKDTL